MMRSSITKLILLWIFSTTAHALQSAPDTVDFGQVPVSVSRSVEVVLYNPNFDPTLIDYVTLHGRDYALPAPPLTGASLLLGPSDSLRFPVHFAPTTPGPNTGELRAGTGDETLIVPLRATATAVFIGEVLADPPSGPTGDANQDGQRHTYEDEFVELYNAGPDTVSLTGWRLGDDDVDSSSYFHFPADVRLAPGTYLVVFGGGEPGDIPGLVFVDDGRIGNGLSNSGDQVVLLTANGDTADAVFRDDWGNKRSVVRWPAGAGAFISHDAPPATGDLFSPNRPRVVLTDLELLPTSAMLQAGDSLSLILRAHYSDASYEIIDAGATWTLADTEHIILHHNTASFTKPGSARLRAAYLGVQSNILTVAVATPPNRPPQFLSAPDTTARAGFSYSYQVEIYDADDDTLYLALDRGPDWMHFATNTLDGLPPPDRHGPTSVRLTLSDDEHTTYQEFVLRVVPKPDLMVSEILADPPGDVNGDGDYDRYADEFIEIFNRGPELNIADWRLSDDDVSPTRQFRFPPGSTLPSGAYLVLFGGGRPQDIPGLVFVDDGRIGNGLTNGGDRLLLIAPDGPDTLIDLNYSGASNLNQSLVPQRDTLFTAHGQLPGLGPFSPGRPRLTYKHFRINSLDLTAAQNTGILNLFAYDGVDTVRIDPSLFTWQVMHEMIISINKNGRTKALHPGTSQVEAWAGDILLATESIRVQPPPDHPPEITSLPDTTVYAGGNYLYQAEATDPEGSIPIYRLIRAPLWLDVHPFNGHITGRAPDSSGARVDIILGVDDSHGGLSQQRYNLHILPRPNMHITEVLTDPPPGPAGDANGDGQRQTYADEFVEIFNAASTTVDLGGWYLSDADRHSRSQFHFPTATHLPPHSYAVVFGGGKTRNAADLNDLFFAAQGRIGDGLNNKQDEIYLIDPEGPDTLARRTYALVREPNQSLHWSLDAPQPILHAAFPGRDPFSPGRPRPVLLDLRLAPPNPRLIAGTDLQLKLVGTFSDDGEQVLIAEPIWHSTDPAIASVDAQGTVAAIDSGSTTITAQLDTFAAPAILLRVRRPLEQRLAFQPQWRRLSLAFSRELVFRVHSLQDENLHCRWSVNGRPQPGPNDRAAFTYTPTHGDTISVRVENRNENATRQWIVAANLPPIIYPLQDTLAWIGKTYQTSIACSDPDDDPLLYTLVQAPTGMYLNAISGILEWMPTDSDSGSTPIRIDVLDGQNTATLICTLRVLSPTAKSATPLSLLHNTPNPFNATTTISFYLANDYPTPTSIRIYNVAGQSIYTLLNKNLTSGWHTPTWNGTDATGNPAASGLYFCVLQHGPHRRIAKLLLLR